MEIKTPIELLQSEKQRLLTAALDAPTKERNKIKKILPEYDKAIEKLTAKVGELFTENKGIHGEM